MTGRWSCVADYAPGTQEFTRVTPFPFTLTGTLRCAARGRVLACHAHGHVITCDRVPFERPSYINMHTIIG
jgi:hypothetical protein